MLQNTIQQALQNAKNRGEDEGGFTLIELLVVILIIGILAAIALPTFLGQSDKSKDSAAKSNARNAVTQVESCLADGGNAAAVDVCGTKGTDGNPDLNQFKDTTVVPTGSGTGGYTVEATSASGNKFKIVKSAPTGGYTYTCDTLGKAGCTAAWGAASTTPPA